MKKIAMVMVMVILLAVGVAEGADLVLTNDGKVPGTPFKVLQDQIDQLKIELQNIQLTPGPKGDKGEQGIQGIQGEPGPVADLNEILDRIDELENRVVTEVPENDYVYRTNVNSGWVIVPIDYFRWGEGWYKLIMKPDGRPYSNLVYSGYWQRDYYYKLVCTVNPALLTATYPPSMGGALAYPGLKMCE